MTSVLSWLDNTNCELRALQEQIKEYEEPGTLDELGIGPIRDALSNRLFPGVSTIQTRARYFLFVPWHFMAAAKSGHRGDRLLLRVERDERSLIQTFLNVAASLQDGTSQTDGPNGETDILEGLIGRRSGADVQTLPSTIYWSGLHEWGILRQRWSRSQVAHGITFDEAGNDETRTGVELGGWHSSMPAAPQGFPRSHDPSFELSGEEASWLQERILASTSGSLLAHLVANLPIERGRWFWDQPVLASAPKGLGQLTDHTYRFALVIHGAALLYNLLISDELPASFEDQDDLQSLYRELLTDWANKMEESNFRIWDLEEFWRVVTAQGAVIPKPAVEFVRSWWRRVAEIGPENVPEDKVLRDIVRHRVRNLRGAKAVLFNPKLLENWSGASGAERLNFRWGNVERLLIDIDAGLRRA